MAVQTDEGVLMAVLMAVQTDEGLLMDVPTDEGVLMAVLDLSMQPVE